ncbi:MAG: AMP nucleosidase [Leptospiraceae bacterium]|nr:AMP nucleosidase [Leptospiraceae bacterium]
MEMTPRKDRMYRRNHLDKLDIAKDWLKRYTGSELSSFGNHILITNFKQYMNLFSETENVPILGLDSPMQVATSKDGITMINFGIGSPNAALIMDLLTAIMPKAVLFLGKCGSLKKNIKVGDLILPIAGIRGEGTSDDYADPKMPSLPSFRLQRAVSSTIINFNKDYYTGTVYSTNRRLWETDSEFKNYLTKLRATAIDMETATVFIVGFMNNIPRGALLLVSDEPMTPDGIKTSESDKKVSSHFVEQHVQIGIDSLRELKDSGESVKHLKFATDNSF